MNATCPTIRYDIFIAGDIARAKQTCRSECFNRGLCVTVEPVTYIYTGGEEEGVRIGLINYPRFPADKETLQRRARELAHQLMHDLFQHSYSIVGPDETEWFSRREPCRMPTCDNSQAVKPIDAKLITAAPDLLDALKGLLEVHDAMGAGQSYAATKARAAITRAEPA